MTNYNKQKGFFQHVSTLHTAIEAYVEAESSQKVRQALRSKLKNHLVLFPPGSKVFYKRENSNCSKETGMLIGQDGKIVVLRHDSIYIRLPPTRVI